MKMSLCFPLRWLAPIGVVLLLALGSPVLAAATQRQLEARLVWGTDDANSPDPTHKPLDPDLVRKLKKYFKYKNYFEVNRQTVTINEKQYTKVQMSKHCHLELKECGESRINVKFYGDGKLLREEKNYPLPKGETLAIGGDVKDGSAWLVIVLPVEPKAK